MNYNLINIILLDFIHNGEQDEEAERRSNQSKARCTQLPLLNISNVENS